MGTIIKSVGISGALIKKGLLALASSATKQCLRNEEILVRDIGMILYAGVYNENHQGEPSTASLIQNRILEDNFVKSLFIREHERILSFDIHNGGGGILDAIRVADSFISSGELKYGLIIAGDSKPVTGPSINYTYSSAAGAILLTNGSDDKGFRRFNSRTYPEFINDIYSTTNWDTGNFRFKIDQKESYLEDCLKCAEDTTQVFLEQEKINPEEIDLLITSQSPSGFRKEFIRRTGFNDNITVRESKNEIYSAGLIYSLNNVFRNGCFKESKNILFLTVGSGITVSISLYRN
jgi:3-oxoacyl-[acyl-carrier-protein] synthase-3